MCACERAFVCAMLTWTQSPYFYFIIFFPPVWTNEIWEYWIGRHYYFFVFLGSSFFPWMVCESRNPRNVIKDNELIIFNGKTICLWCRYCHEQCIIVDVEADFLDFGGLGEVGTQTVAQSNCVKRIYTIQRIWCISVWFGWRPRCFISSNHIYKKRTFSLKLSRSLHLYKCLFWFAPNRLKRRASETCNALYWTFISVNELWQLLIWF